MSDLSGTYLPPSARTPPPTVVVSQPRDTPRFVGIAAICTAAVGAIGQLLAAFDKLPESIKTRIVDKGLAWYWAAALFAVALAILVHRLLSSMDADRVSANERAQRMQELAERRDVEQTEALRMQAIALQRSEARDQQIIEAVTGLSRSLESLRRAFGDVPTQPGRPAIIDPKDEVQARRIRRATGPVPISKG